MRSYRKCAFPPIISNTKCILVSTHIPEKICSDIPKYTSVNNNGQELNILDILVAFRLLLGSLCQSKISCYLKSAFILKCNIWLKLKNKIQISSAHQFDIMSIFKLIISEVVWWNYITILYIYERRKQIIIDISLDEAC